MFNIRQDRTKCGRIALRFVGRDFLGRHTCLVDRTSEESFCGFRIVPLREIGINHLSVLVDRPIDVGPLPVQASVRFIYAPFCPDRASMDTGSFAKQWQEPLDSTVDRATVHDKTTFGEPLDDVGVAQAVPNVPANCQSDNIIRETMM